VAGKPKAPPARRGSQAAAEGGEGTLPQVAIVGGSGSLASEALGLMLVEGGSLLAGIYPDPRALRCELDARAVEAQVALLDGDDRACGNRDVAELRRTHPSLRVMLLCETLTPSIVRCAIDAGIDGVVLKSDSTEDLIAALGHVLDGRAVMPAGWQTVPEESERDPLGSLSTREREVLELAATGLRNREIAERLMISSNTVKFHLRAIYAQLGVRNRVQAARAVQIAGTD
jgi:DNA-binding NarL/FixJ family response regulator